MSDVTIIGLGAMGKSLAECLLRKREITVWNRSRDKGSSIESAGGRIASTVSDAVGASPVMLVCVSDYAATQALFSSEGIDPLLRDRVVVQLSTGTPQDAVAASAYFAKRGARYLDGTIMAYPAGIGRADSEILLAGDRAAFEQAKAIILELAGASRYLGRNVRAPAALDLAWLSRLEGLIMGTLHGARLCEAEGIPLSELARLMPEGDRSRSLLTTIESGDFVVGPNAGTVAVAAGVIARLQDQARAAGIDSAFPDLMMAWFTRAIEQGYGEQDTAATIHALRDLL